MNYKIETTSARFTTLKPENESMAAKDLSSREVEGEKKTQPKKL